MCVYCVLTFQTIFGSVWIKLHWIKPDHYELKPSCPTVTLLSATEGQMYNFIFPLLRPHPQAVHPQDMRVCVCVC